MNKDLKNFQIDKFFQDEENEEIKKNWEFFFFKKWEFILWIQ